MNNKLVSIIVPIYNSEHYLYECINSVIEQEYNNWELILVDDSSTDSSYHICEDYCSKKSNIRLLKNKSKGVSAARNLGIRNATGDYLVFLDSDDMLSKHALQLLVSMIENYDFGMGTYESLYSNGKRLYHNIHPFKGGMHSFVKKIYEYILDPILQGPCWKIFKRNIVSKYDLQFPEKMSYGEDACFVYDYLFCIKTLNVFNSKLYSYRIAENSLSHGYKPIKFYTNLLLDKKIQKLCGRFHVDTQDRSDQYVRNLYASLINEVSNAYERELALDMIKKAAKKKRVIDAYANTNIKDIKKMVIKMCINYKCYNLLFRLGIKSV